MTSVPPPFEHPGAPPPRPELPEGAPEPAGIVEPAGGDSLPRLGLPVWVPFLALLVAFVAVLFAGIIVGAFTGFAEEDEGLGGAPVVILTLLQGVLFVAVAWYAVPLFTGRKAVPAMFGLRRPAFWPAVGWALLAYLGFLLVAALVQLSLGEPEDQQLIEDIREEDSLALLIGLGVLSCFAAPIAEELFFRGFMFRVLAERLHWLWAALISGGVFGVIHAAGSPAISLLVLSAFGVALCLLLWRTGSVLPCIALHALNNSISFGATKELPAWGLLLLISGSVVAAVAAALVVSARRSAPA